MQAGGNRARFFAPQAAKTPDTIGTSTSSRDASFTPSACSKEPDAISSEFDTSNTASSTAIGLFAKHKLSHDELAPHRSASDSSEGDTTAQRTRMTETEIVYNGKREGYGRLNVSGLIKHVDTNFAKAVPQSANIKEAAEDEELGTRSPRQYQSSKLISKSNPPSYSSAFPHFTPPPPVTPKGSSDMPPSNQLAQSFKMPSHHAPRSDVSAEDASRINQASITSHADTSNSHISSRLPTNSCDDSIKSLTTAFNRKHSGAPRNSTSRFPSPVSHHSNSSRSGRARSPHGPVEDDPLADNSGSFGQHGLMIESRNYSSEISNDGDFQETIFQGSERYHGSVEEQHGHNEPHRKRGEKRISDAGVDDACVPLGKRARIDMYDEQPFNHGSNSSVTNSPDLEPRNNESFKDAVSHERRGLTRQDAQLKICSGQDVDEYVATHMDRYEAARKRWTECSGEEWEKGADELIDKFSKVLDFVKEQMKRRVALYASLHTRIDKHQKERDETAEMLKRVKGKLVAKTGVVVEEEEL